MRAQDDAKKLNRIVRYFENRKGPSFTKLKSLLQNGQILANSESKDIGRSEHNKGSTEKSSVLTVKQTQPFKSEQSSPRENRIEATKREISQFQKQQRQLIKRRLHSQQYDIVLFSQQASIFEAESRSNLFPPLSLPKLHKQNHLCLRYEGDHSRQRPHDFQRNTTGLHRSGPSQKEHSPRKDKIQSAEIFDLKDTDKYNLSLKSLINKVFKSKLTDETESEDVSQQRRPEHSHFNANKLNAKLKRNFKSSKSSSLHWDECAAKDLQKIKTEFGQSLTTEERNFYLKSQNVSARVLQQSLQRQESIEGSQRFVAHLKRDRKGMRFNGIQQSFQAKKEEVQLLRDSKRHRNYNYHSNLNAKLGRVFGLDCNLEAIPREAKSKHQKIISQRRSKAKTLQEGAQSYNFENSRRTNRAQNSVTDWKAESTDWRFSEEPNAEIGDLTLSSYVKHLQQ